MSSSEDSNQGSNMLLDIAKEWGDLVRRIPALGKAMTKLVGDAASAGGSWIDVLKAKAEQRSSYTRAITDARQQTIKAVSQELKKQISGTNNTLGVRALEHFAEEIIQRQENREVFATRALGILVCNNATNETVEIAEDWLNIFSVHAERASSDRLRDHWAAILAGELRKPGSISLLTLEMMSVVDNQAALVVSRLSKYIMRSDEGCCISLSGSFGSSPHYDDLLYLEELNFLKIGMHSHTTLLFKLGNYALRNSQKIEFALQVAILPRAGRELVDLIHVETTLEDARYVYIQVCKENSDVELVELSTGEICSIESEGRSSIG